MVQQIRNFFYNTETFVWTRDEGPGGSGRANSFSHHANVCDGVFEGGKSRPAPARVPYRDDYVISYHVYMVNLCEGQRLGAYGSLASNKIMLFSVSTKKKQAFSEHFCSLRRRQSESPIIYRLLYLGALSIQPQIPEISVGSQMERTISVCSDRNIRNQLVHFDRSGHFRRSDRNVPFHLTKLLSSVPLFCNLLTRTYNQTRGGLGQVFASGMYLPLGAWNFRNFKPDFLLNGKRPRSRASDRSGCNAGKSFLV